MARHRQGVREPLCEGGRATVSRRTAATSRAPPDSTPPHVPPAPLQVRLQLAPKGAPTSLLGMLAHVVRAEGVAGLFGGLTPALLRQASYQSIKMGTFDPIKAFAARRARVPPGEPVPFWILALAGGLAGALGTVLATPTEIAKVRLQAGAAGGVSGALASLHAEAGLLGMWLHPSVVPNVQRSFVVNAAELAA